MGKIKIYSGLSLTNADINAILPSAEVSKPIRRGDLISDIKKGVSVVGIVDGRFYGDNAVSPSEILDCIRCGMKVYGSSSMGAMRAAELHPYGMIGVGRIFEHIVQNKYFRDDFLGLSFLENAVNDTPFTYMDMYFCIADLIASKKIKSKSGKLILNYYQKLHFSERTISALNRNMKLDRDAIVQIQKYKESGFTAKAKDALALVNAIRKDLAKIKELNLNYERL